MKMLHLMYIVLVAIAVAQNSTDFENVTEIVDNCDMDNSTCTTTVSSIETSTANITTETPKKKKKRKEILKLVEKKYCSCNLHMNVCEVNCCCDKDCSYDDKFSFKFCSDYKPVDEDPKFCNYYQQRYINNTLYEWEIHQSSLFCIYRTNLPKRYTVQKKQIIKNIEEAEYYRSKNLKWPQFTLNQVEIDYNVNYTYGDDIWFLKNYTNIYKLEIPDSFITDACLMKKKVKYLQNLKTSCSRNSVDEYLTIQHYNNNLTVLSSPQMFQVNITRSPECPKNVCIPLVVYLCRKNNCTNLTSAETKCAFGECKNLVEKVRYVFYHNGTHGIRRANVYLDLFNSSVDETQFSQTFIVEYLWDSKNTKNYTHLLSGNPGYLVGKTILLAHLVTLRNTTVNTTTNETKVLVTEHVYRDGSDFTKSFMVLPKNVNGKCVLSNEINLPIEFGYNLFTKCTLHKKVISDNRTAQEVCRIIQDAIFEIWSLKYNESINKTVNLTVGLFGNANATRRDDWIQVVFTDHPLNVLNNTFGDATGNSVKCYNIATKIRIDLYHSREEEDQQKLAGVSIGFSDYFNLSLVDTEVTVRVRSEVMFMDITSDSFQKYVTPPSLNIKLPHDFFYPFVKLGNYGRRARADYALLIFVYVFVQILTEKAARIV
ncbi:PREDICTED: tectonic-1 [Nicrophorus vespilloides]|uniref:Tectonic-1 n=1 Tax=Nicrophorus vespilloides TaxID=110193 RepID=A0ABM1NDE8_NICVS|nr:PREDICTED: tectonic-1 [Nicrophorus vespilloides]